MALDNDDKKWFIDRLDAVGSRLGEKLEAVELTFGKKLEAVELTFGKKLEAVELTFGKKLETVELTFGKKLETVESSFSEKLEAMETRLLTAFHQWASPIDARLRSHSAVMHALDLEQEALSERVTKLEGK